MKVPRLWSSRLPGLVVDLVADHRRVLGVAGDDLADHPLGMEQERRVGVVDLLTRPPRHRLPGVRLAGDLRVGVRQPGRGGVGGGAEDDPDAAGVGPVQHGFEPVEVEDAVARLPGGPDRLADPDDGEVRLRHQVEITLEVLRRRLVLEVVGRSEADPCGLVRVQLCTPVSKPEHGEPATSGGMIAHRAPCARGGLGPPSPVGRLTPAGTMVRRAPRSCPGCGRLREPRRPRRHGRGRTPRRG